MKTTSLILPLFGALTLATAACSPMTPREAAPAMATTAPASASASAALKPTQGSEVVGELRFATASDGRILVSGQFSGLKPGSTHGFHIHEFGDCSAPDASSAGGHFNPSKKPHAAPGQGHDGAMKNLVADAQGKVTVSDELPATVNIGKGDAFDIVDHAVIVHSDPDDYQSQPVGNAGSRLACGVIQAAR